MKKRTRLPLRMLLSMGISLCACTKYLDKVPDNELSQPRSFQDLQALLDNDLFTVKSAPGLDQLGTDDYFISYATWAAITDPEIRNAYVWDKQPYPGQSILDWDYAYKAIYYANVVLDNAGLLPPGTPAEVDRVKGAAWFYRAFMYYELEETFGQPYRQATAATDSGVVLRLHANPYPGPGRATVRTVYDQVTGDLERALPLLPDLPDPLHLNRPSRAAVFALLARICLTMQDYIRAGAFADSCLHLYSTLLDYNTLDTTASRPFTMPGNAEVLFQCSAQPHPAQYATSTAVDTGLYASYDGDDLRRALFFKKNSLQGTYYFRGQYTGLAYLFSGLATDEVWLIRAECYARGGDLTDALADLNELLVTRWRSGVFIPYTAATATEALGLILSERRKETLFRDLRWSDLRRLGQDSIFAKTLTRVLNGKQYTLPPGDPRYAWPLPDDERMPGNLP
jgi:tetratricopeptide (TPR) repeat protein